MLITQSTTQMAQVLSSQADNEALTSSSLAHVEPFNSQARQAFYLMLNSRKNQARERITASHKHKYIQWFIESIPERLDTAAEKKRA